MRKRVDQIVSRLHKDISGMIYTIMTKVKRQKKTLPKASKTECCKSCTENLLYNLTNSLTLDFCGSFHYKRKPLFIYNENDYICLICKD